MVMPVQNRIETRYRRLWFGLEARVTTGPVFLHRSGFGTLLVPHPPIANELLRWGMPRHAARELSFAHEFAHLQAAPLLLVYLLLMGVAALRGGRAGIGIWFFLLASAQAAWELISEGIVFLQDSERYRMIYMALPMFPRALFWTLGCLLMSAGWMVLLIS